MRLTDWLRRRERQAQALPSLSGSSTPPLDDYAPSAALHAAIAMDALFPDTAREVPLDASKPLASEPPA